VKKLKKMKNFKLFLKKIAKKYREKIGTGKKLVLKKRELNLRECGLDTGVNKCHFGHSPLIHPVFCKLVLKLVA